MKKSHILFAFLVVFVGSFVLVPHISAATEPREVPLNGEAAPFGGFYQVFFGESGLQGDRIDYVKVDVTAKGGNKMKVSLLYTENWVSTASEVASTDTLKAQDDDYIIYFVPKNMSCPTSSNSVCVKVPAKYSSDGNGNDLTYDVFTGLRFTNESWFYGALNISGTAYLY